MKFLKMQRKGITFIELIVTILILAIGVAGVLSTLAAVTRTVTISEEVANATFYAQEMMEKAKSTDFASLETLAGTTSLPSDYQRTVSVAECQLNGSSWEIGGNNTGYKMVTVSVSKGASAGIDLVTVMSDY